MGMSASQARLIALTARMNDIEYQGQQINQQRTTLSNQTNSYNTQLLEMSVPTPPSTSDYTKIQYAGTFDASNFTISNVVPTGKNNNDKNTYTIDFTFNRSGSSVSKSNTGLPLIATPSELYFTKTSADKIIKENLHTPEKTVYTAGDAITETPTTKQDVLVKITGAEYAAWTADNKNNYTLYDEKGNAVDAKNVKNDNTNYYIKCSSDDLNSLTGTAEKSGIVKKDEDGKFSNVFEMEQSTTSTLKEDLKDDQNISDLGLYTLTTKDGNNVPTLIKTVGELKAAQTAGTAIYSADNADAEGAIKAENPNYNSNTPYSVDVNGTAKPVYKMSATKDLLGEDIYNSYLKALKNAFPSMETSEIEDNFFVYLTKTASGAWDPYFVRNDQITNIGSNGDTLATVNPYKYDEDGTFSVTEPKEDCQLEFDASSGRITKVGIPGDNGQITWIDVKSETVTDQLAYQDAMNNYEYEKAKYDKAQQDINAKISIVQQQDKSLELKLTRLDNERNAVNTEIDAVKKVVQDNIEKSYKTFSG